MTSVRENGMQRYGMVIGVKPEMIVAYKQLHAAVWPAVLAQILRSHIRNYSIYLREPENLLFSYAVRACSAH
jgi:L-rhamnose mutarotase